MPSPSARVPYRGARSADGLLDQVESVARVGCEVIAEEIEEPAELEMLRELGIQLGQGYLLGRAAPAAAE